jgi:hypothetical protein
LKEAL